MKRATLMLALFTFVVLLSIGAAKAVDIVFVEETRTDIFKRWDTVVDARGTTIFGVDQSFKLQCTGEDATEGAFAFKLSPLIRINGVPGFFVMDCSKGVNEFTFSLTREGLDALVKNGEVSFFTDIEFAGTEEDLNFTPLTMDVNFRTTAKKAKLPPDRDNELVSAISEFNFFEEDPEESDDNSIEERLFRRASPQTGEITIRAQATFPVADFESKEELIETFLDQISTIELRPKFKTTRKFLALNGDREAFVIKREDVEILNVVNALIRPNDSSSETYLVDFSAKINTSIDDFKVARLLRNRKNAVRELKRNGNVRERFLKQPITKRAALNMSGQGQTIFKDHRRIVIPIIFTSER